MVVRPPRPTISIEGTAAEHVSKRITVHHPGYTGTSNVLIVLLAADGPNGGLDLEITLTICAILADNRFDGYISRNDAVDASPVRSDEGLLAPGEYFFHVPHPTIDGSTQISPGFPLAPYCYPVVPFFESWRFPHERLPPRWQQATTTGHQDLRPAEIAEYAHIIPKSERDWFARNGMRRYGNLRQRTGEDLQDDSDNIILLRSDVRDMWDNHDFVFVPKCAFDGLNARSTGHRNAFFAHVLHGSTELLALYHNLETQPLAVPSQYLIARLAWAIFPDMQDFLLAHQKRLLVVRDVDTGCSETAWYNPVQCKALLDSRRRSRSAQDKERYGGDDANDEHCGITRKDVAPGGRRRRPPLRIRVRRVVRRQLGELR
ncbi:hypothetical protein LTR56_012996 [Elasticomyces elasticus]|nr:hypothetical protein LTR56_012996 [Elasticomyces elasticus]KAK3649280.1 hypothetical protein LTR22_013009 [Elasticomyces elasticus]KAK4928186.1 hypothetical protein LTR49_005124 [Elasticomyces elasticus]KAK5765940.1 hypothetical protein LTS12_003947 [Elasticomyces elasticus]